MFAVLSAGGSAVAQNAQMLQLRTLAASCASCHGTDGRTVPGSAIPALSGLPASYIAAQMTAFKDGSKPATVMPQIAKGFNSEQINALAAYFAGVR